MQLIKFRATPAITQLLQCFGLIFIVHAVLANETPDLSILEQRKTLSPYLQPAQQQTLRNADRQIQEAQRAVNRGENLLARKPSKLKPDEDVSVYHRQGQAMIEDAEATILAAQQAIAAILTQTASQRTAAAEQAKQQFNFQIPTARSLQSAFSTTSNTVLQSLWKQGYTQILYPGIYGSETIDSLQLDVDARNDLYDRLTALDGNRFSVSIPNNFRFDDGSFAFDDQASFSTKPTAILLIQVIQPTPDAPILLVYRAIDAVTLAVLETTITQINNTDQASSAPTAQFAISGGIEDGQGIFRKLSQLPQPYSYQCAVDTTLIQNQLAAILFEQTLFQNADIELIATQLASAFGSTEACGTPTVELTFEPIECAPATYQLIARMLATGRSVAIGRAYIKGL